jgi:hypothetical protein
MKKSEYDEQAVGFAETLQSFDPKTKLTVGLSRYSAGGSCYVFCDGARSQFRSYNEEEKGKLNANLQRFNGLIPMEHPPLIPDVKPPTVGMPRIGNIPMETPDLIPAVKLPIVGYTKIGNIPI